jgi:hypothetical protein
MPQERRLTIERGLIWMAKYGMINILSSGTSPN